LRQIHVCHDCLRTFVIDKPPLRKKAVQGSGLTIPAALRFAFDM
jgi:hypothetical protein